MKKAASKKPAFTEGLDSAGTRRLLASASDIVLVLDRQGQVLDVAIPDEQLGQQLGNGWRGRAWRDTVTVESRDKIDSLLADARAGTPTRWRQVNHALGDGAGAASSRDDVPVSYTALALADAVDEVPARKPAVLALGRDLRATALLQRRLVDAQQAMERDYWRFREAETRYRTLFQTASEAVLIADGSTQKVLEANPSAETLFGRASARLAGVALTSLFDSATAARLQNLLAPNRAVSADAAAERVRTRLAAAPDTEVDVAVVVFRQQQAVQWLVRVLPAPPRRGAKTGTLAGAAAAAAAFEPASPLLEAYEKAAADALVFTDAQGRVLRANGAFATLTQLATPEAARGQTLDRWLGRAGVELDVLLTNLRNSTPVAAFATVLRGEVGVEHEVEIAATRLDGVGSVAAGAASGAAAPPVMAFAIRDTGRRLDSSAERGGSRLARTPTELTELVGRVPMKDIVAETAEVIEQLCIETALQMTHNNRALAAQFLGLSRQSLYVKLRRYGLGGADGGADGAAEGGDSPGDGSGDFGDFGDFGDLGA
jgi:transcriptional regulator PpsR